MGLIQRVSSKTPKFFKKLRNIGLCIAAAGTAIAAAPIALPSILVTISGYLITAGTVMTTVSQAAVEGEGGE